METYLLKMILCSAIFIGFYYLILERQKSHQFKRFYLLSGVLFSMLIHLISITYGVEKEVSKDLIFIENQVETVAPIVVKESVFTIKNIIYAVYIIVTTVLLLRFLFSLNALRKEISAGKKLKKGNITLVLNEATGTAHSFWKFIFLNRKSFEEGTIDEKIIRHEELHLEQKHSFDVLLMEFLLVVFWFNPAFYFYKKAILTNHEFLADEHVLKYDGNIKSYQQLLLAELVSERILFTNQFNLSNTKKRIKMMTTPHNKKTKFYNWLTLPLAAALFFAFVEKVPAKYEVIETTSVNNQEFITRKVPVTDIKTTENSDPNKTVITTENYEIKTFGMSKEISKNSYLEDYENKEIPISKTDTIQPKKQVLETQPEFPGGYSELRNKIMVNVDVSQINPKPKSKLQGVIYFKVMSDGESADIVVESKDEVFKKVLMSAAEQVTKNVKWKPGTKDGKPEDSHLKIPVTLSFE